MMRSTSYTALFFLLVYVDQSYALSVSELSEDELFELSIEELLDIRVSGATLTDEAIGSVPSSVSVFTRRDFMRMGVNTVEELVNFVPGFQLQRHGDTSYAQNISSRARKSGSSAREILVIIDGLKEENNYAGGSYFAAQIQLSRIEKIEFIRGPGSVIYGANAFLGVINITTIKESNALGLSAGSNQFVEGWGALGLSSDDNTMSLDAYIQYAQDSGDDYNVPSTFEAGREDTTDAKKLKNAQLKFSWHLSHLSAYYSKAEGEKFYELGIISNERNKSETHSMMLSFAQDMPFSSDYDSQLKLTYAERRIFTATQLTPAGALSAISEPSSEEPVWAELPIELKDYYVSWAHDLRISSQQSVQFGLDYRQAQIENAYLANNFDIGQWVNGEWPVNYYAELQATTLAVPAHRQNIYSAYLQYQLAAAPWLDINLGGRFDHYESIAHNFSPRIAFMLHPSEEDSFKLIYGSAFRAPLFIEQYLQNNLLLIGNPEIKPETVDTYELIWLRQQSNLLFSMAYFHNTYKDSIVQVIIDGGRTYTNTSEVDRSQGIELELSSYLNEEWQLRLSTTMLLDNVDSAYRESDKLASGIVNYHHKQWNVNLGAYYHSAREYPISSDDDRGELSGYWVAHTKLSYEFLPKLRASLQIKNLFDRQYATPAQSKGIVEGIPAKGREIRAAIRWDF